MFKVQLLKIAKTVIKDKRSSEDVPLAVLTFNEINQDTNKPTKRTRDKYLRMDNPIFNQINTNCKIITPLMLILMGKL